jgi:formylmethanofuran dehydrogenase subunit D
MVEDQLQVTLITGRTIEQGVGKEQGKASEAYAESVAVCYVDPQDLKKLKVKENSNVLVSTEHGSVVVKAVKSLRGPHVGIVFVPYGPWANAIIDPSTDGIGMPSMKGISAQVEPAPNKQILSLTELLKVQFGR